MRPQPVHVSVTCERGGGGASYGSRSMEPEQEGQLSGSPLRSLAMRWRACAGLYEFGLGLRMRAPAKSSATRHPWRCRNFIERKLIGLELKPSGVGSCEPPVSEEPLARWRPLPRNCLLCRQFRRPLSPAPLWPDRASECARFVSGSLAGRLPAPHHCSTGNARIRSCHSLGPVSCPSPSRSMPSAATCTRPGRGSGRIGFERCRCYRG